MFFKFIGYISIILLFVRCSEKKIIKYPPKDQIVQMQEVPQPTTVSVRSVSCLKQVDQDIKNYLSGEISHKRLNKFWSCIENITDFFVHYVRGKTHNQYDLTEIEYFLSYFNFNKLSYYAKTFFVILKSLVAPKEQKEELYLTKKEIVELKNLIHVLRDISHDLQPYVKLLSSMSSHGARISSSDREEALRAAKRSFKKIRHWSNKNSSLIDISVLKNSLMGLTIGSDQIEVRLWIDLLLKKGRVFSQDLNGNKDREKEGYISWNTITKIGEDLSGIYVYRDALEGHNLTQVHGIELFNSFVQEIGHLVKKSLQNHPRQAWSISEVNFFIKEIAQLGLLNQLPFNIQVIQEAWRLLSNVILNPHGSLPADAFTLSHWKVFEQEFKNWHQVQLRIARGQINQNLSCKDSKDEIIKMINCSPWPLRRDKKGFIVLSPDLISKPWNQNDLSTLNWKRALMRQFIRVYGSSSEGLTQNEITMLYNDFWPILSALGIEPSSSDHNKSAKNSFILANIFTPSADRNNRVNLIEGISYLDYLFSAINLSNNLISRLELDSKDRSLMFKAYDFNFYWENLKKYSLELFKSSPNMGGYIYNFEPSFRLKEAIFKISNMRTSQGVVTYEQIVRDFLYLSFLETFMLRYDRNLNQTLGYAEVEQIVRSFSPHFKSDLLNMIVTNNFITNVLTFSLKYHKDIKDSNIDPYCIESRCDNVWAALFNTWWQTNDIEQKSLEAERVDILEVAVIFFRLLLRESSIRF